MPIIQRSYLYWKLELMIELLALLQDEMKYELQDVIEERNDTLAYVDVPDDFSYVAMS